MSLTSCCSLFLFKSKQNKSKNTIHKIKTVKRSFNLAVGRRAAKPPQLIAVKEKVLGDSR